MKSIDAELVIQKLTEMGAIKDQQIAVLKAQVEQLQDELKKKRDEKEAE